MDISMKINKITKHQSDFSDLISEDDGKISKNKLREYIEELEHDGKLYSNIYYIEIATELRRRFFVR